MKHAIWGFFMVLVALIIILIIMTVTGRMQRNTEVNSTISEAVEQSVNAVMNNKAYTIDDKDEFVADVLQNLLNTYENDADITIKIATADKEKGLLGIKVIETFEKPNHGITEDSYEKIVLLETDEGESTYNITFVTEDGSIFQKTSVNGGEVIILPNTKPEGCTGWAKLNSDGSTTRLTDDQINTMIAGEDLSFVAVP